jgi:Thioredoxin-like proteins and domains
MLVTVEATPNPRTRKFLPGRHLSSVPREFTREMRGGEPLVQALFALPSVRTVLVNEDAVSVTVDDERDWKDGLSEILSTIEALVSSSFTGSAPHAEPEAAADFDEADATVVETIRELIETRIRPAVARDGGDIIFRSYRDGVLGLEMRGACSGCPSSATTLQHGIRNLMLHFVPEIRDVVAV